MLIQEIGRIGMLVVNVKYPDLYWQARGEKKSLRLNILPSDTSEEGEVWLSQEQARDLISVLASLVDLPAELTRSSALNRARQDAKKYLDAGGEAPFADWSLKAFEASGLRPEWRDLYLEALKNSVEDPKLRKEVSSEHRAEYIEQTLENHKD
jgi:hypothetical protein